MMKKLPYLLLLAVLAGCSAPEPESVPQIAAGFVPVGAEESAQQAISRSRETAITRAVRKVSDSVVGINVIQVREFQARSPFRGDPFFEFFFPTRPYRQHVKSLGSGFILDKEGYVLTNEHVVSNAVEIKVTLTDGTEHLADIVGLDQVSDIALLKIREPKNLKPITFGDSDQLIIGEWVIALGNPFGLFDLNAKPTVTVGVVSAVDQDFGKLDEHVYKDMIQTDASINQGNSGGPLVNALGEVIGMNTFIFSGGGRSGGSIGVGFAIPSNRLKKLVAELRKYGRINRSFSTGLQMDDLTPFMARYLGAPVSRGVIITNISKGSPAEEAGLKVYDIILEMNNIRVQSTNDIFAIIADSDLRGGDVIGFKIWRDGDILSVTMKLKKE